MRDALVAALAAGLLLVAATEAAGQGFVNFEPAQVHPLDLTPDGTRLLAVNTPGNLLEVFDVTVHPPVLTASIFVGLDPVSVRARTDNEAWVVNMTGDSVSVVDLSIGTVTATLRVGDEPADVAFAGTAGRAFVSIGRTNELLVFDPADLSLAPVRVPIMAESPRALAVSPAGDEVYVAVFESGNGTTIIDKNAVKHASSPYGGTNPPPNDDLVFDPPFNGINPAAPEVAHIVRDDGTGTWIDDNGRNWTELVSGRQANLSGRAEGWTLLDHDVAVIDAESLAVSYIDRIMTNAMAIGVNPADGRIAVVGLEAINEVRFESNLTGIFVRVMLGLTSPTGSGLTVVDTNPHLDYTTGSVPIPTREQSLGDPRGIAWNAAGTRAYVTGKGSNNVIVLDGAGARAGLAPTIEVGQGPAGVVVDDGRERLYVLNGFENSLSVISTTTELETARVAFHDPTPAVIKAGRPFLYDTHATSGLGQISCASCHIDSRSDQLCWDLGNPAGDMVPIAGNNLGAGVPGLSDGTFTDFHPMKGPLRTQTLQDIIGHEPFHWRGDKPGLEDFNGAFTGLQGADAQLTAPEMQAFEDFLATIHFPPNPYRILDNSFDTDVELDGMFTSGHLEPVGTPLPNGDAAEGLNLFMTSTENACIRCHSLGAGSGPDKEWTGVEWLPLPVGAAGEHHEMLVARGRPLKVPQLRDLYTRVGHDTPGFSPSVQQNTAGFGMKSDGSHSLTRHLAALFPNVTDVQTFADVVAFLMSYSGGELPATDPGVFNQMPATPSQDSHAAVGFQVTVGAPGSGAADLALVDQLLALADAGEVGFVAHGKRAGRIRGFVYQAGVFQSDRAAEQATVNQLKFGAVPGAEMTFTAVVEGTQTRIGIDRDEDGHFDQDELDAFSDPGDAASVPGAWRDRFHALFGTGGVKPSLFPEGPLVDSTPITLTLSDALPSAGAFIVVGLSELNAPFEAGILVPNPDIVIGLSIGGDGRIVIADSWPSGVPSGFSMYLQYWIQDAGGPTGWSASNAVRGTTP